MREARRDVRELDVWDTRVRDALLRGVATTFTGLTSLDMDVCDRITDAGVAHLAQLTGLTSLDLSECRLITDAGVAHLRDLLPRCRVCDTAGRVQTGSGIFRTAAAQ